MIILNFTPLYFIELHEVSVEKISYISLCFLEFIADRISPNLQDNQHLIKRKGICVSKECDFCFSLTVHTNVGDWIRSAGKSLHRCHIWTQSGPDCPKCDKYVTFTYQISIHFGSEKFGIFQIRFQYILARGAKMY